MEKADYSQMYAGQMYPHYRNLVVKSTTTPGQFDIWKNAIEKADNSQTEPGQMYLPARGI